jgi:hypothetical protein
MFLLCTVGQEAVMWMHNNQYFVIIRRGIQNFFFIYPVLFASLVRWQVVPPVVSSGLIIFKVTQDA